PGRPGPVVQAQGQGKSPRCRARPNGRQRHEPPLKSKVYLVHTASSFTPPTNRPAMNYEQARFNMIEQQIRPWEVLDNQVLSLLAVVKREDFVPPAHAALAFVDMEIPLGSPHTQQQNPGQCMLAPKVEARILQDLAVQKHEKVLEIGTGSGYMAALLAHRA